jgi:NDP-sugar pyrophosphorylase family protein
MGETSVSESWPVVILVGGMGTRLGSNGEAPPKALVEVGDKPILWHIMKIYAAFGHTHFVLTLGYRGDLNGYLQRCAGTRRGVGDIRAVESLVK